MPIFMIILFVYLAAVSLISIAITIYDKSSAKKGKWRISENTLMLTGLIGGATAMLITMKLIRHKTLHKKFMYGLPLEIIIQIIILIGLIYLNVT